MRLDDVLNALHAISLLKWYPKQLRFWCQSSSLAWLHRLEHAFISRATLSNISLKICRSFYIFLFNIWQREIFQIPLRKTTCSPFLASLSLFSSHFNTLRSLSTLRISSASLKAYLTDREEMRKSWGRSANKGSIILFPFKRGKLKYFSERYWEPVSTAPLTKTV